MHALNTIPSHLGFKLMFSYFLTCIIVLLVVWNTAMCIKYVQQGLIIYKKEECYVVFVHFNLAVLRWWPGHRVRDPWNGRNCGWAGRKVDSCEDEDDEYWWVKMLGWTIMNSKSANLRTTLKRLL